MTGTSVRRCGVWLGGVALTVASFAATSPSSGAATKIDPRVVPAGFTDTLARGDRL